MRNTVILLVSSCCVFLGMLLTAFGIFALDFWPMKRRFWKDGSWDEIPRCRLLYELLFGFSRFPPAAVVLWAAAILMLGYAVTLSR